MNPKKNTASLPLLPTPAPVLDTTPEKLFGVNDALLETMFHDPNLTLDEKAAFSLLCKNDPHGVRAANIFCLLMKRNYIYLEGFGYWSTEPPRRSLRTKIKEFFGRFLPGKKH